MVQCQLVGRTLVAAIEGEFDLNITDDVRAVLDGAMDSHPEVRIMVLDLSGVSFIDSSGAGVIFGRHKRLAAREGGWCWPALSPRWPEPCSFLAQLR